MKVVLPRATTAVFSSGLARVTAQVGIWGVLTEECGLRFDEVVGTSTGAINAAMAAQDPTGWTTTAEDFWAGVATDKSISSVWRSTMRSLTNSQSARTRALIEKHLYRVFEHATFDDLALPLTVVATNLGTGHPRVLTSGSVAEAVLASAAFPVVTPPVEIADDLLVDGSMVAGIPINPALVGGAKSVVILDTGVSAVDESEVSGIGWYEVMALAATHMLRVQAEHDVVMASKRVPILVVSCNAGSPFDLRAAPLQIESGKFAAREIIGELAKHPGQATMRINRKGIYGRTALAPADV